MKRILSLIAFPRIFPVTAILAIGFSGIAAESDAETPTTLPDTIPLAWKEEDLSERLMNGAHAFVERKIAEARRNRFPIGQVDLASEDSVAEFLRREGSEASEEFRSSLAPRRQQFRRMIGAIDERVDEVEMEKFGTGDRPGLVAENDWIRVWQVRWPVFDSGVWSEGLLIEPTVSTPRDPREEQVEFRGSGELLRKLRESLTKNYLIALPDADVTPESFLRIGAETPNHALAGLAKAGFTVVIPTLINRAPFFGENEEDRPKLEKAEMTHREWIYRQAFQMGRHPLGLEVQKVLAAVDWAKAQSDEARVGCYGEGEGGLIAWFATAIDPRISAVAANGILSEPEAPDLWKQPIDRNLFGFDRDFGWEGAAELLHGRDLWFLAGSGPHVQTKKGNLSNFATTPGTDLWKKLSFHLFTRGMAFSQGGTLVASNAYDFFAGTTHFEEFRMGQWFSFENGLSDQRPAFSPQARHQRLFRQLEDHIQKLIREADEKRDEWFLYQAEPKLRPGGWSTEKSHPTLDPEPFIENAKAYRRTFAEEAMGQFDEPLMATNPRSRLVAETDDWAAWDVVLDVYPELFAWGILVLPKNLESGEKRPVVVCQHGRNGVPRDCLDADKSAYNDFAARLAERGFITFIPHNLYRGEDRYRWLDRKANAVGGTLFSFIIPSHRQILNWLKSRPDVDPDRIAFYGLSYGGETAMRVPPVLEDYAVVICSGDFNQWTRKVAATEHPATFMTSIEWEMPYWNLGNTFDYAEMAYLIFPRPFLVERGHHDRVGVDAWVAHEYAKVRHLYAQFGLAERTEIEFFQGGHSINGKGSFDFLHRHLDWPKPSP